MPGAETIMHTAGPVLQVFTPTRILSVNRIDVGQCVAFSVGADVTYQINGAGVAFPLGAGSVRGFPVGAAYVTFSATVACELMTPVV